MSGSYIEAIVVLEKDWPLRSINGGSEALGLDHEIGVLLSRGLLRVQIAEWFWGVCCFIFSSLLLLLLLRANIDLGHG